jgi:hypothetical protein
MQSIPVGATGSFSLVVMPTISRAGSAPVGRFERYPPGTERLTPQ